MEQLKYISFFNEANTQSAKKFGAKAANLADISKNLSQKIHVPYGCGLSIDAYHTFIKENDLQSIIESCTNNNIFFQDLQSKFINGIFSKEILHELGIAYNILTHEQKPLVVRSSATYEDTADLSAAGQHDSFLHISSFEEMIDACKKIYSSLFTSRAMAYRKKMSLQAVQNPKMAVCIQQMISNPICSGVLFTGDPEYGTEDAIVINSVAGLSNKFVNGESKADEFIISKKSLIAKEICYLHKQTQLSNKSITKSQISKLLEASNILEKYYQSSLDIEWVISKENKLYIVQARPLSLHSKKNQLTKTVYSLNNKPQHKIGKGIKVGSSIISAECFVAKSLSEAQKIKDGSILVVPSTSPDWLPVMVRASGLITECGGRTCHAAIVAREIGIPAAIGVEGACSSLKSYDQITLDTATSKSAHIFKGIHIFSKKNIELTKKKSRNFKLYNTISDPQKAYYVSRSEYDGVGLVRIEFIMASLGIHPTLCLESSDYIKKYFPQALQKAQSRKYQNCKEYFIDTLAYNLAQIGLSFGDRPVIVRTSDLKSNEYKNLIGGDMYEQKEENPMLGLRGASRYLHNSYKKTFIEIECAALQKAKSHYGAHNLDIMIPFIRSVEEIKNIKNIFEKLSSKLYMMIEVPATVINLEAYEPYVDGFSIGSNDLAQMTFGADRDSSALQSYNEYCTEVKMMIEVAVEKAHKMNKPIGICGQGPVDNIEFALWLEKIGITSISIPHTAFSEFYSKAYM